MSNTAVYTAIPPHIDEVLSQVQRVGVVGHVHPDADAMGSVVAMVELIARRYGVPVQGFIGSAQPCHTELLSIPGVSEIQCVDSAPDVDFLIAVDCSDAARTGCFEHYFSHKRAQTWVIDHHASNSGFGGINTIDAQAPATAEMILGLYNAWGSALDQKIAHALYAGLITDTGSFRWGRPSMHVCALQLLSLGIDSTTIAATLFDALTPSQTVALGDILRALRIVPVCDEGESASVVARDNAYCACLVVPLSSENGSDQASGVLSEKLTSYVHAVPQTCMGAVVKERQPGVWSVSLRSSLLDVSEIAVRLGGGGHAAAAGYTSACSTDDAVIAELIATTRKSMEASAR